VGTAGRRRDRLPARRFCVVVVAQPLRARDQRGRHQLHAVGQMVWRCADARLYQAAAEKRLSEKGGGAGWASLISICGYWSLICLCPLWVITGHSAMSAQCPVCPRKRTWLRTL